MSRCPAHDDRTPSLSITAGKDGRVLLKCHGPGCTAQQIVAQIGMTMADLFPAPSPKQSKARGVRPSGTEPELS